LEFVIEDEDEFETFLSDCAAGAEGAAFAYDDSYKELTYSHILRLSALEDDTSDYSIAEGLVGKMLYSTEEHRIIFYAMGVHDGGGTRTSELSYFTERFNIDWAEFEKPGHGSVSAPAA